MIWVVLLIALLVWANWPNHVSTKPHFKRSLDGEVRFVEYRHRAKR